MARFESAVACKKLAEKIDDHTVILQLLTMTFAVFNGSDGKLTVVDHKISVLEGAGNFSYNAVSGSGLQQVTLPSAQMFIQALKIEVNEKVLCYILDMMCLWINKFSNEVPKTLIDSLKVI